MTRAAVFFAALVARLVVAYVTFASVDGVHCIRNFVRMLHGVQIDTPYLPGIEVLLWVAGIVTAETSLPLLFPWKVVPALFDALIALLLFDAARDRRAGWLYALIPVPVVIACIHPQWESMFLYALLLATVFADRKPLLAGVALVVSIIVKPVAVPLAILLLPRNRRGAWLFIGGGAAAAVVYALILAATGEWPDLVRAHGVVQYAEGGVQVFGLAMRPKNRLIAVGAALAIAALLWFRERCSRAEAVMIFFAVVVGLSGLSVQYLAWIVPFAVLCGRYRFTALYTIAAGLFVLFYYQVAEINLHHIEDLGGLAMLRPLAWLGPPLPPLWMGVALQLLGNAIIPLLLLGFAALESVRMLSRKTTMAEPSSVGLGPAIAVLAACAIVASWAFLQPRPDPVAYGARVERGIAQYDVVEYRGPHVRQGMKVWIARSLVEDGVANRFVNATTIGLAWIAAAALMAALSSRANGRRDAA